MNMQAAYTKACPRLHWPLQAAAGLDLPSSD